MLSRNKSFWQIILISFSLLLFLIPACSSDTPNDPGGGNQAQGLQTVSGQVSLPQGCTTDPATLNLTSSASGSTTGAGGAFALDLFDRTGQLVIASTSAGHPFLMGWIGDQNQVLSARSTAEVLTWMSLGSWMLPYGEHGSSRQLVTALGDELDALETAIANELIAHPEGLTTLSVGIRDALSATVADLLTKALTGSDKGVLIQPSVQRSGVEVLNRGGLNSIVLKNSYRRRVWVSLDRIGYVDQEDIEHELDEVANIFEIGPVAGFAGVVGTIGSYFNGNIAYTPVETEPIALQNITDAKYSIYTLVTGGMGVVPPDVEDALSTAELEAIEWVALKTTVWDFFVPLVMNIVATAGKLDGVGSLAGIEVDNISSFFTVMLYIKDTLPTIYMNASDGNIVDALHDLWGVFTSSNEFQNLTFNLVRSLFERLGVEGGNAAFAIEEAAGYLSLVGWVDIVGRFIDTGLIAGQIALCDVADRWDLRVTDPKVTILPLHGFVQSGAVMDTIRANVDDDTGEGDDGSAYAYHWTCDGQFGHIVNPIHPNDMSNDFQTSSNWVSYEADPAVTGRDSLHVEVYKTLGGQQTFVGSAASAMQVSLSIDVRLILRGSPDTDFDMTIQDWHIYDYDGVMDTEDVQIYKWVNGEPMFPNYQWIYGGPDDIAVTTKIGWAKIGDLLTLDFCGYPSWFGPAWLHYVGEGIHEVKKVTDGQVMPRYPGWSYSTYLDQ